LHIHETSPSYVETKTMTKFRYHGKALDDDIQKVLYSPAKRGQTRLIYATSTAETALTIEGLVIVVDPGLYPF
jgi:hypothetical protein